MNKEEWITRCAARYSTVAELDIETARSLAKIAFDEDPDGNFAESPEDAADEDMSYWQNDEE